jgi:hypothetical protein
MNAVIRCKLDMAERAYDFCRVLPVWNQGYTAAVQRLEKLRNRMHTLAQQQVAGRLSVTGAVLNTERLRREIHDSIAMLAGLARSTAQEAPELRVRIAGLRLNLSHQVFLTRARVAAETASSHRDVLIRYGMPETFLDDLGATLDRFEQTINEKHAGQAAHVGARADLSAVSDEIMLLVGQLDSLNRLRFRNNAELLAAWKSARDVAWRTRHERKDAA